MRVSLLVNFQLLKNLISIQWIFHRRICNHFSARYEEIKHSGGSPYCHPCTCQTNLVLGPTIIPQFIFIVLCPPVYLIILNSCRILELEDLPIHYPSLFLLTLQKSQTQKGSHHHIIIIRFLHLKILISVLSQAPLRHTTSPIFF